MTRRAVIFLMLAASFLSSLVTWYLTSSYDYEHCGEIISENRKKELFPIVYCRQDIAAGTKITADLTELRVLHINVLPANACSQISQVVGKTTRYLVKKGDPIDYAAIGIFDRDHPPGSPNLDACK